MFGGFQSTIKRLLTEDDLSTMPSMDQIGNLHVWRRTADGAVDYLVSVNPDAYQEGSDAKPAGYTLRPAEKYNLTGAGGYSRSAYYSDSITVNDDGTINLPDDKVYTLFHYESVSEHNSKLRNKFVQFSNSRGAIYIPSDAVFSAEGSPKAEVVDKAQIVDSYPAIPAGTTIKYLGQLGDKARMQIVSYVGTGTYGESNPCSITADFPIESAEYLGFLDASGGTWPPPPDHDARQNAIMDTLTTEYANYRAFCSDHAQFNYAKKSSDNRTITWYNSYNSSSYRYQLNESGAKYYFLCRG